MNFSFRAKFNWQNFHIRAIIGNFANARLSSLDQSLLASLSLPHDLLQKLMFS